MTDTQDNNFTPPEVNIKNLSFAYKLTYNLFPDYFVYDTYRDTEFCRIDKSSDYALDLDYRNDSVKKVC